MTSLNCISLPSSSQELSAQQANVTFTRAFSHIASTFFTPVKFTSVRT